MVTTKIQKEFPEQYKVLSETPLFLFDREKEINTADFEHYLESLKKQLAAFKKSRIATNNLRIVQLFPVNM